MSGVNFKGQGRPIQPQEAGESVCNKDQYQLGHEAGEQEAWRKLLRKCLKELGQLDLDTKVLRDITQGWWVLERHDTLNAIKTVFEEEGWIVEWPDDLSLPDIIEKHLWRNFRQ